MKNKLYILVVCIMLAAMIAAPAMAAQAKPTMEHQVKAAFLYNFTKFVDWPEDKEKDNDTLTGKVCMCKHRPNRKS